LREKRGERALTGSGEGVAFPGGIGKANPKAVLRGESIPPGDNPTDLQRSQAPRKEGCGWRGDDGRGGA